jgi:hypothetical protein
MPGRELRPPGPSLKNTTSNASFTRKKKIGGTKQYTKNPTAMSEKIAEKRKPPWSDGRMMVIRYKIAVARAIPPAKYRMTARQNVCGWCEGRRVNSRRIIVPIVRWLTPPSRIGIPMRRVSRYCLHDSAPSAIEDFKRPVPRYKSWCSR